MENQTLNFVAKRFLLFLSALCALVASRAPAAEPVLTLDEYLTQVRKGHLGIQGADAAQESAKKVAEGASLVYTPNFFLNAQYLVDRAPATVVNFFANQLDKNDYSIGVSQLTSFGLQAKLSYNISYTIISGINFPNVGFTFPLLANPSYFDAKPVLELSQSIWKNGFGRATSAVVEATESQSLSQSMGERYQKLAIEASAEVSYWRLALARESVLLQKDSVARALKIRDENRRRVNLRLADESDLYQAEAALRLRELELQSSSDEERTASQSFNASRGLDSQEVKETLTDLEEVDINKIPLPVRAERRADVEAALYAQKAASANSKANEDQSLPDFQVYSQLALNSRNPNVGNAFTDSFNPDRPTAALGFRLSVPLDFDLAARAREGYRQAAQGAELKYRRKLFEQESDWKDLVLKYAEARKRFELATLIEEVQEKKYRHEKNRHERGRSTIFLVLQFEQDYKLAQFSRLGQQAQLLTLIAQMKTFRDEK